MATLLDSLQATEKQIPEATPEIIKDVFKAANRILFESRQNTCGESILADIYDDIVGIIPEIGNIVGSGPRILDAMSKEDIEATLVHSTDLIAGLFYPVGYFIDLVVPGNTILKSLSYYRCLEKDTKYNCLFPDHTIERSIVAQ